ncbi:MAG: DUF4363 family protein [Clostridia bacterium]|nr:DUF4363 family protein [Clostridia bacterium]
MYKELAICIITIIIIIAGNILTEKYTKSSVDESTNQLAELKEVLISKKEDNEEDENDSKIEKMEEQENEDDNKNEENKKLYQKAKEQIENIHKKWDEKYNILAFYLEHNELEKIETELTGLRASIETEEYDQAVNELDKAVYLLKHVDEKNRLSWKNIF